MGPNPANRLMDDNTKKKNTVMQEQLGAVPQGWSFGLFCGVWCYPNFEQFEIAYFFPTMAQNFLWLSKNIM